MTLLTVFLSALATAWLARELGLGWWIWIVYALAAGFGMCECLGLYGNLFKAMRSPLIGSEIPAALGLLNATMEALVKIVAGSRPPGPDLRRK